MEVVVGPKCVYISSGPFSKASSSSATAYLHFEVLRYRRRGNKTSIEGTISLEMSIR